MSVSSRHLFGSEETVLPATPGSYGSPPPRYRLPEVVRLGPVRLAVSNLERSLAWYGEVLGLAPLRQSAVAAELGAAGASEPLVVLEQGDGVRAIRPGSRLGLYHYAILLPDRASLGRLVKHLADIGARAGASDHLVSEALYLQDPDGLGIEVYADRPREAWQRLGLELKMATDPFDFPSVVAAANGEPWTGMPVGTVMGHVHLHVGELEHAGRFYSDALGFDRMVWRYPGALFLAAGGYHHHLGTNTWAQGAPPAGAGDARLLEWTIVMPAVTDVTAAAASVSAAGFTVEADGDEALLVDPWGTTVRLRHGV
jgi:catechol 2,3-dioxygenase